MFNIINMRNFLFLSFIIIFIYVLFYQYNISNHFNSCPPILDPKSFKTHSIHTPTGQVILRRYMMFYFNKFLKDTHNDWNYILPNQLAKLDKSNIFLLDVRKPIDYRKVHIIGSTNIFWLNLLKPDNLNKIPTNKKIILICYVGHTASQILVLLKLLGYDAAVLKFGMGISPQTDVPIAGWTTLGLPVSYQKN